MADLRDYKQLELSLVTDLEKLRELAQNHAREQSAEELARALARLHSGRLTLAVVGEFKRGKSTLINALLGQDILPTDVLPTTATLNRLVYSLEKRVELHYRDDTREVIPLEKLGEYVTKLNDEAAQRALSIREAVVHFPCHYCRNNVQLVDTPGLQDEAAMTDVTMQVLPNVDAAVLVISALSPLSESELMFLEQLAYTQCARVFIVVSSLDRLENPEQVDRLLLGLRRRLEKMDEGVRQSLHPQLYPLSAYQALQGRLRNDGELVKISRMGDFEQALERFLTEERGAAALLVPVQIGLATAAELRAHLEERVSDWKRREAALQARKEELDRPARGVTPREFQPVLLERFLQAEPVWKEQVRRSLNDLLNDLPQLAQGGTAKAGLFAAFKASLETREQLPRQLFAGLQEALQDGLKHYEQELLRCLDRLWDDFVDFFPGVDAGAGLARNGEWTNQWMGQLRERLRLDYAGGFQLQKSWQSRPDLWVLRAPPQLEIRRELEGELIRQLGLDLTPLTSTWLQEAERTYRGLVAEMPSPPEQNEGLRTWVRDSVLLEKEQADLRQDWARLEKLQSGLQELKTQLQRLASKN